MGGFVAVVIRFMVALQPKYEEHHPRGIAFVVHEIQVAIQHLVNAIPLAMQASSLLMCSTNQFSQAQGVPQFLKAIFGYQIWFQILEPAPATFCFCLVGEAVFFYDPNDLIHFCVFSFVMFTTSRHMKNANM